MAMSLTNRYASDAGDGAFNGTSEANAWRMVTDAAAIDTGLTGGGFCLNIKGNVSTGAYTLTAGAITAPNLYRFYNSTIGDLDDRDPYNADGTFNTTDVPTWTATGSITMVAHVTVANVIISNSVAGNAIAGGAVDNCRFVKSKVLATANNAAARCLQMDEAIDLIGCEFECSGAAHASPIVDIDAGGTVTGCRFKTTQSATCLGIDYGVVTDCVFTGHASSIGIAFLLGSSTSLRHVAINNTFYGIATGITLPNAASTAAAIFVGNHATDLSSAWVNSLYSGTTLTTTVEVHNRLRDVTADDIGLEPVWIGIETTDTGGASTDYTNAGSLDFRLITAAPGRGGGMIPNRDMGASQHVDPSGGGALIGPGRPIRS